MAKLKIFVGVKGNTRKVFRYHTTPTKAVFGGTYNAVIGPFRTLRGAAYMADFGRNNPHVQTVSDAEELAQMKANREQMTKKIKVAADQRLKVAKRRK